MTNQIQKISKVLSVFVILFAFAFTNLNFTLPVEDSCPTAYFVVDNNGCTVGCTIDFDNQSTGATTYCWDFGDGSGSCDANPSHVYGAAGTYTVTLRASDGICTHEYIGIVDIVSI